MRAIGAALLTKSWISGSPLGRAFEERGHAAGRVAAKPLPKKKACTSWAHAVEAELRRKCDGDLRS